MTISDATRAQRVKRWTTQKRKWVSKLEKANNSNDTDTANAMIAEADSALGRLGVVEAQADMVDKPASLKLKVTSKEKDKTKPSATTKNSTGSLGL